MTFTERWTLRNGNKTVVSDLLSVPLPETEKVSPGMPLPNRNRHEQQRISYKNGQQTGNEQ